MGKTPPFSDIVATQTDPDTSIQTHEELSSHVDATSETISWVSFDFLTRYAISPNTQLSPIPFFFCGTKSVVDNSLRAYGAANMRVVDASIIPLHTAAHTQVTVYAIAEKVRWLISLFYVGVMPTRAQAADAILGCI
ncbi:hypothetical protein C8Q78DRAFT_447996 [Trametes maxima]|nr:hypothetical protein C8Q78DRAFT_447996 [Trametes maxima]